MPEDSQTPSSSEPVVPQPPVPPVPESPSASPMPAAPDAPAADPTPYQPPVFSQPVVSQPVVSAHSGMGGLRSRKVKKPLVVAGAALAAAVLVGGGLVFGLYLPNTPGNVFSAGLENTGKVFDKAVTYTQDEQKYDGADLDGSMKVKSPGASFDVTFNASYDKNANATGSMNADVLGAKVSADFRSVHLQDNTSPDMYFRVNGIKNYLDTAGLQSMDRLDGQWITVDHTLIDTYVANLEGDASGSSFSFPTYDQTHDAMLKAQDVNKRYIFTTNATTAVLKNKKFIKTESVNGRSANHYQVGYDKSHLEAYVTDLGKALDGSKLNDWAKKSNNGKSLSQVMDIAAMKEDISKNADSNYAFDLWVDTGTKLVSKLVFTDPQDSSSTITFAQSYTGGDELPMSIAFIGKDDSGNPETLSLDETLNLKTHTAKAASTVSAKDDSGTTTVNVAVNVAPRTSAVKVTAPSGSVQIVDLLNELGLGGMLSDPSASTTDSMAPLFFQQ